MENKKRNRKEYHKKYYQRNKEKYRKRGIEYRRKIKSIVLSHYGGNPPRCACCGESHIEFLTIDHIDNKGAEHRRKLKLGTGTQFYNWLIKNNFPERFQVLCWNCNCSKTHMGYCPHEKER